ncbi:MAG TPA: acyl carrier protein, partial [Actinomycetota bacterium]|nr:acyl carrier protein [Actinomycetota bacterium]
EVLGAGKISLYTPILDVCDSLAASQCLSRVEAAFGLDIPLDLVFDRATNIAELAAHIDRAREALNRAGVPATGRAVGRARASGSG